MGDVYARLDAMSSPGTLPDYGDFYRRELPAMVALAAAVTGSNLGAEDIAQDALIRALKRWDHLSGYDKPGAWLRRVTINLALSNRKRATTELKAKLRLASEPRLSPAPEFHQDIWGAVRRLPGKQRAAIALYYLEDRSVVEIADILDCAENTAKVHLHRGRKTLTDLLEPTQGADR